MAITFDTATTHFGGSVSSLAWNHNNQGNFLIVGVGGLDTANRTITSATFNSIAMTSFGRSFQDGYWTEGFYLADAPQGNFQVSLTWNAATSHYTPAGSVSFDGVDTVDPLRTVTTQALAGTTINTTLNGTLSGNLIADVIMSQTLQTVAQSGQTERFSQAYFSVFEQSFSLLSPGGNVTFGYFRNSNAHYRHVMAEFKEAVAGDITEDATDAYSLTDTADTRLTAYPAVTDLYSLTDTADPIVVFLNDVLDAYSLNETAEYLATLVNDALDAYVITEEVQVDTGEIVEDATDAFSMSDVGSVVTTATVDALDAAVLSDLASGIVIFAPIDVLDTFVLSDTGSSVLSLISDALETYGLSDLADVVQDVIQDATDVYSLVDLADDLLSLPIIEDATDAYNFVDSADVVQQILVDVLDNFVLIDQASIQSIIGYLEGNLTIRPALRAIIRILPRSS